MATTQIFEEGARPRPRDVDRVVGQEDLYARFGIKASRSTIWRWVKNKSFPRPIRLGENKICWLESEIEAWLRKRARERRSK
jgi:prophage regulatory protein